MPFELSLLGGALFGLCAGLMAFLIFFEEYGKHGLSRVRLWKEALYGGCVAFAFFMILSLVAGYVISR
jgi:uncharacterized membrane protein YagU involved in acid resistance